jgi:hypothetical protein
MMDGVVAPRPVAVTTKWDNARSRVVRFRKHVVLRIDPGQGCWGWER